MQSSKAHKSTCGSEIELVEDITQRDILDAQVCIEDVTFMR